MKPTRPTRPSKKAKPRRTSGARKSQKSSPPPGYHHGDLKLTLIHAALKLLKTTSVYDLSLRQLARAAGVSEAAPYRHFKNKEELLAAISEQGFNAKADLIEEAELSTTDPREQLLRAAEAYLKMAMKHPEHFRLMAMSYVMPTPERQGLYRAAKRSYAALVRIVMNCQKAKVIGPGDPLHKAMHCWASVHGFTSLMMDQRLSWLGVEQSQAYKAMRTYTSENILGLHKSLSESDFGFSLPASFQERADIERLNCEFKKLTQ